MMMGRGNNLSCSALHQMYCMLIMLSGELRKLNNLLTDGPDDMCRDIVIDMLLS